MVRKPISVYIKSKNIPEAIWKCKKCGLMRSNKLTHKHGEK